MHKEIKITKKIIEESMIITYSYPLDEHISDRDKLQIVNTIRYLIGFKTESIKIAKIDKATNRKKFLDKNIPYHYLLDEIKKTESNILYLSGEYDKKKVIISICKNVSGIDITIMQKDEEVLKPIFGFLSYLETCINERNQKYENSKKEKAKNE